ncbi:MAG: VWA domain-containing protein [Gemmataceae bacterium]
MTDRALLARWRLVLGEEAEQALGCSLEGDDARRDRALGFLYDREYTPGRNVRTPRDQPRDGGTGDSRLTVPEWINEVHVLFPRETIERIEHDALARYELTELVTNPELLARAQPSLTLLQAILHTRHLMNPEVLALARDLARRTIQQLVEQWTRPVRQGFQGARHRRAHPGARQASNFDPRTTIRRNLAHFSTAEGRLHIHQPFFYSRVRRQSERWQVIVLVDESGSMASSVIHAAVTAAIFAGIPSLRTHLVLFDTNVVDLSDQCSDPVEVVLRVQLGGGTDIARALEYAHTLVQSPRQTLMVVITDFFEGGSLDRLLAITKQLVESGVTLLGLAALDEQAHPNFNRDVAGQLASLGVSVGAMTPGQLAEWVARKVS